MKLFFLINDKPGGAEQVFKEVALAYLKKDEAITVCFLSKRSCDFWDDCLTYHNFKQVYARKTIVSFFRYLRWCNENVTSFYTTHVYLTGLIGTLMLLRLLNKREFIGRESTSIFTRHRGIKLLSYKLCYFFGYPQLDLLICQTSLMKEQLIRALPKLERRIRIEVIPNPINLDSNSFLDLHHDETFDLYGDFIVAAGRLIPEKGFDILIDAFVEVKKKHNALKLVILGDGIERDALTSKIIKHDIVADVFMPGFTKNVYSFFKSARVCVVSSRLEGFPNVLLQMMSQNEKVVSTLCAGDIDKIPGIILTETNAYKLSESLTLSLESDSSLNRSLFDDFLEKRSIEHFVAAIKVNLDSINV